MKLLGQIRGYACVFDEWSSVLDDGEPFVEMIRPGAFRFLNRVIAVTVLHDPKLQVATTWDKTLRIWQDSHGLAFEADIPATMAGLAQRNMVASGGVNSMSVGLITLAAADFRDEDGMLRREVTSADVDHISLCAAGAYLGTACWLADMPPERKPPHIAAASRRWYLGHIAHEKKQAADRKMVANFLATPGASERFFAKAG